MIYLVNGVDIVGYLNRKEKVKLDLCLVSYTKIYTCSNCKISNSNIENFKKRQMGEYFIMSEEKYLKKCTKTQTIKEIATYH